MNEDTYITYRKIAQRRKKNKRNNRKYNKCKSVKKKKTQNNEDDIKNSPVSFFFAFVKIKTELHEEGAIF